MKKKFKEELETKVWYRILKVLYIVAYILLPFLLTFIIFNFGREWHRNNTYPVSGYYIWNIDKSIGLFLITTVVYILIVQLIKKAILYIILGKKVLE